VYLMSNEHKEIKDIVAQLQRLQIQETELLLRLERLSGTDRHNIESTATREFKIGDLVKIKNPKPFQIKKGKIIRIGTDTNRITVQSTNGSKIVRAPSNLIHIN
jgi:hypothetical protein